jgi:hypothetical protein
MDLTGLRVRKLKVSLVFMDLTGLGKRNFAIRFDTMTFPQAPAEFKSVAPFLQRATELKSV